VPLIVYPQKIAALVSDDAEVAGWLEAIVGILVPHMLTRIVNLVCAQILIPMGSGTFRVVTTFFAFYILAAPISGAIALSNSFTTDVTTKMRWCVGTTSIAQFALAVIYSVYLARLDWGAAARVIRARANTDRQQSNSTRERELRGLEDGSASSDPAPPLLRDALANDASADAAATTAEET
jgi:hypothetical protein